jgi:hypothetical protein
MLSFGAALLFISASRLKGCWDGSLANCCKSDGELLLDWCQLPTEVVLRSALGFDAERGGDARPSPICSLLAVRVLVCLIEIRMICE